MITLSNTNDTFAVGVVEQSNRRYDLEKIIGEDILQQINDLESKMTSVPAMKELAASTILGLIAGLGYGYKKKVSRRKFIKYALIGSASALSLNECLMPFEYLFKYNRFIEYLRNDLASQYPEKKEAIIEYLDIRYPPIIL